jgi:hypothetical protein
MGEDIADRVHHAEQRRGDFRIEEKLAGAKFRQQAFGGMGDRFQLGQPHKAGRSLNAVQRPKYFRQRLPLGRVLLEPDEVGVEQREIFVGLEQEFAEYFGEGHYMGDTVSEERIQ